MSFEVSEYRSRIERTQDRMEADGLDLLIIAEPANMNFLTGYDSWTFYVPQVVLLEQDAAEPVWIGKAMDEVSARRTTWLSEANIRPYGKSHDSFWSAESKHPMHFVAQQIEKMGRDNGTVGLEMETHYFAAGWYRGLLDNLPQVSFTDTSFLVRNVRTRKSDAEIEYVRNAGQLTDIAMQRGIEAIEEGARESTVAAEIMYASIKGTDEYGGDYPAIVPMISSGSDSDVPHYTWSDRQFEEGDGVTIEISASVERYHAPLARTVYLGSPPREVEETAEIIVDGLDAAIDEMEPGVSTGRIYEAWQRSIRGTRIAKKAPMGYTIGLGYPPDWGEHTVHIKEGDDTLLEPNMTFHMFPAVRMDGYGIEISETVGITEDGVEVYSDVPRDLIVV